MRKQSAIRMCVAIMATTLVLTGMFAIWQRWQEDERAEEAQTIARQQDLIEELRQWIREAILKYGVEEEEPQEEQGDSMREVESQPVAAEAGGAVTQEGDNAVAAAGITYSGFDWRAVVASCQGPGWKFTDSPTEYMAYAMKESTEAGDLSGRASHLWRTGEARYYGEPTYPMSQGYQVAADIFYAGWKADRWLECRGAAASEYYGRGLEVVSCCVSRGRCWENLYACLECESTYGLGGSIDFGILYGNYPNTIQGYCDLLDMLHCSNDPWEQAYAWNEPGGDNYASGFCRIVETIKEYRP